MMRYHLASHISIQLLKKRAIADLPRGYENAVAILRDKASERDYLINDTIRLFIQKFSIAKDIDTVHEEIAAEAKTPKQVIKRVVAPFFEHICRKGFIVAENQLKTNPRKAIFRKKSLLGNYRIEHIIDITPKLDVYLASSAIAGQKVVIKLLKQKEKEYVEQIRREFRFLSDLNKSGVTPKALALTQEAGYIYFVQEYIAGLELNDFRDEQKKISLRAFLKIAATILNAFRLIHQKGIVHGDIHPANIFMGKKNAVKIIDFGLALNHRLEKNELVKSGGAYFYMPPERISTDSRKKFIRQPDFYSDVYQLGVVLYTMLYDNYPFNGVIWETLSQEIKETVPQFDDRAVFGFTVPGWLKSILAKCLSKDPGLRYAHAGTLYRAFIKYSN